MKLGMVCSVRGIDRYGWGVLPCYLHWLQARSEWRMDMEVREQCNPASHGLERFR